MRSALLSFPLLSALRYTALHCMSLLSSYLHFSSFSFPIFSTCIPFTCSHCCCALLRSAPLFSFLTTTAEYTPSTCGRRCFWVSRFGLRWTLWICAGWSEEEDRERGEGAPSSWESKGIKVVAVVIDGCLSRVMPWDLRAFRQLELETLSHFCPPSGAVLILVLEKLPGTSGCTVKSGHHEPTGRTTATQLDHQKTVPCSLSAICTPA